MSKAVWAGLDVGTEMTSICVITDTGRVLQSENCPTKLEAIHPKLRWLRRRKLARVGLEAATGFALARGLRSRGYKVDLYEARQLSKFLRVRRNKTDAGDALGIAEAGRIGATVVSKVHLKSLECQVLQSRLAIRRHLIRQRVAAVNLLCRQIELYGGRISRSHKSPQFRTQVEGELLRLFGRTRVPLEAQLRHLLEHCEELIAHQRADDRELYRMAFGIETCRRFMDIPGVGPICALSYYAAIGEPERFVRARDVGAYFGLTPRLHQSGVSLRAGRITRMGNVEVRTLLTRAGFLLMRSKIPQFPLRDWAKCLSERRGRGRAKVAVARKLAIVMLLMWKRNEDFRPDTAVASTPLSRSRMNSDCSSELVSAHGVVETFTSGVGVPA